MKFLEYQAAAMRTASPRDRGNTVYSALAIAGEAGEFVDLVKKRFYHLSIPLDKFEADAVLELGDILWGLAHAADALGVTLDDIAASNIAKLKARYPDGFTVDGAKHLTDSKLKR